VIEVFEIIGRIAVLVFVVTCMVAAGLGLRLREVVAPLRRKRLVAAAIGANFVVAPAAAYGLARLFDLDRNYAVGLMLLGVAAGAPFLPKLAELAKGDIAFSVGLMLLLMVASVVFMPIALPLLVPGMSANPWPILQPLLLTMLMPLAIGMIVRYRSERWATRLRAIVGKVSNVSMLVAVAVLIGLNFEAIVGTFGSGAVIAAALFESILLLVGCVTGGPMMTTRSVLGLGTGQRNIAAALIVATQNSQGPQVVAMLLVATLVGLVILVPAARWFARRGSRSNQIAAPVHEEVAG
jgi:BASS family bile acid:Na+ symporter